MVINEFINKKASDSSSKRYEVSAYNNLNKKYDIGNRFERVLNKCLGSYNERTGKEADWVEYAQTDEYKKLDRKMREKFTGKPEYLAAWNYWSGEIADSIKNPINV